MTKSKPLMLVVEPLKTYQTSIEALASKSGYEAVIVSTCQDAFACLASNTSDYTTILLNWCSPFLDKVDLIKYVRTIDTKFDRHTPIVAMMAALELEDQESVIGFDDWLPKPINVQQFRFLTRKYMRRPAKAA